MQQWDTELPLDREELGLNSCPASPVSQGCCENETDETTPLPGTLKARWPTQNVGLEQQMQFRTTSG